jgi:AAHS family 4-hydroxybenzoate transporter-like MFS transporter
MQAGSMRIDDIINGPRKSSLQAVTLLLCFLVVAVDGFDVAAASYVAPLLRAEWTLNAAQLGAVFGAGLFGLTAGSFVFGPLADRIGRKQTMIVAIVLFGLCSLATAAAPSLAWFMALRFLTGLGLGGGMPCAITLSSEYSPERNRPMLVTLMFCGFTTGLAFGGQLAALIMPAFGWRGVFVVGGIVPLVMAPLLWLYLPESIRFMLGKKKYARQAGVVLAKLTGDPDFSMRDVVFAPESATDPSHPAKLAAPKAKPAATLFNTHYRAGTLLLWLAFFCTLWVYYQVSSWLPTVLADAGMTPARAARIVSLLPISGTIGALINAWLMRRINPYRVLTASYVVAAVSIACIGSAIDSPLLLPAAVCCAGLGLSGAQTGANVLVAGFYETGARATGVSWALGVGRFGSIFGSMTGGLLLAMLPAQGAAFFVFALPALIAAFALLAMGRLYFGKMPVGAA